MIASGVSVTEPMQKFCSFNILPSSEEDIVNLNLPTGIPYVFEFDDNMKLQKDYFLADPETLKQLMDAVANQGNKK